MKSMPNLRFLCCTFVGFIDLALSFWYSRPVILVYSGSVFLVYSCLYKKIHEGQKLFYMELGTILKVFCT